MINYVTIVFLVLEDLLIWLYEVRLVYGSWVGLVVGPNFLLCDGLGWVGLKKFDLRTTLCYTMRKYVVPMAATR